MKLSGHMGGRRAPTTPPSGPWAPRLRLACGPAPWSALAAAGSSSPAAGGSRVPRGSDGGGRGTRRRRARLVPLGPRGARRRARRGARVPLSLGRSEGREGAEPWTARPRGGSRRARPTRLRSPRPARRARRVPGAGGRLAPRGGAATDPFTLDAPRPSADIDLSCVGPAGRDEMLAGGPTVERPTGGVARPRGLRHLRRAGRPWRQDAHPPPRVAVGSRPRQGRLRPHEPPSTDAD